MVRGCDVCRVLGVAPAIPASGASSVASINGKVQDDLLFLDDFIVLRALDLLPSYSFLVPVRSRNPDEAWDAFCTSRIAVFAKPRSIQMEEGGERKNELWVDLRADRYIRLQLRGVGAHPWILECCYGLARGIYNRLKTDAHYGFSAYRMVFGSGAVDNFGWGYGDEDLLFLQDASLSRQFVTQWKLRMSAQQAALKEIANGTLRRSLAFNNSFDIMDVRVGDQVLFHRAPPRKSSPRWRGPAEGSPRWMKLVLLWPFKSRPLM